MLSERFLEKGVTGPPPVRGEQCHQERHQDPPKPSRGTQETHCASKKTSPSLPQVCLLLEQLHTCIYTHTYRWTLSMYSSISLPTPNYYRRDMSHAVQACRQNQHGHPLRSDHGVTAASWRRDNSLLQGSQMRRLLSKNRFVFARR